LLKLKTSRTLAVSEMVMYQSMVVFHFISFESIN
jgi:hypothetical protein